MARSITSGFQTEIEAQSLNAAYLLRLEFPTATLFMWTGLGDLVWNSDTYKGVGKFLGVEEIEENSQIQAVGTKITLSGVDTANLSLALTEDYQGRTVTMWFAVFDSAGAVIADPYQIFKGKADVMMISDNGDTSTIGLSVENDLIDLFEPRERNYTSEDQKRDFSTDEGLDLIVAIQDAEIVWKSKN